MTTQKNLDIYMKQVRVLNKKITDSFIANKIDHSTVMHLLEATFHCSSSVQLHAVQIALRKFEKGN